MRKSWGALALFAATVSGIGPMAIRAAAATPTVTLSGSNTSPAVSRSVTLTATSSVAATSSQPLQVFDSTTGSTVASCTSGSQCVATVSQPGATSHSYVGRLVNSSGAVVASSSTVTVTWSDPVVAAAGDIACDPADPNFNGSNPSYCQMGATASAISSVAPNYLLPLGDDQYSDSATQGQPPTGSMYTNGYGASWGKLATSVPGLVVRPVPGNHDWGDVNETDAEPPTLSASSYFSYFNNVLPSGVSATNDWYSYDVPVTGGTWHLVSLDTECAAIGGCGSGSPEETWLRNDLAAHTGQCIAVSMHDPRWSSGEMGSDSTYSALWSDLYSAHAALALAGHDHSYEHLSPRDANGNLASNGVSEFVVGTGGVDLSPWGTSPLPGTVYRQDANFGVLALTLHSGYASFAYHSTAGTTLEQGQVSCPGVSGGTAAPSVTSVSPISGPAAGGTSVTITGTALTGATGVSFGTTPATSFTVNSATSITAVAPALSSTQNVTVTTPNGTSPTSVNDEYTPTFSNNGYAITLAASTTSPTVGGTVTLTATANQDVCPTPYGMSIFDASTGVELVHTGCGTTLSTTISQASAETQRYVALICNSGGANAQADSSPVLVTWSQPSNTTSGVPVVNSVSPVSGPSGGGATVTITGSNLTGASGVSFGSVPATNFTVSSDTSITATSPALATSTVDVTVANANGASATSVGDEFTPTYANGGYGVTLTTSNSSPSVGATVTLTATSNQDVCPTPYGITIMDASTGTQVAHTGCGTTLSTTVSQSQATTQRYVAMISNSGGANAQADSSPVILTWSQPTSTVSGVPVVSSVSPTSGPAAGGTTVTITGSNLTGATGVDFGGAPAASFTVSSDTSITATSPALSSTSTVDVTVVNPNGASATSVNDEFTPIYANGGYGVTLAASATSAAVGGSVTLTATSNQDVCPTPYGITIMDASTGTQVAHTGCGTTLSVSVSQSSAMSQRYVALISNSGGANAQADSSPIVVTWS